MTSRSPEVRVPLTGICLSAEPIQTPIDTLIIDMLASNLASRALREAELEELRRGVKLADVALEYLGLRTISVDGDGDPPLRVVASDSPRDSWRDALVLPEGDRPIGILIIRKVLRCWPSGLAAPYARLIRSSGLAPTGLLQVTC